MASALDLVARLAAVDQQRAIRHVSHRQVVIQPHALIVCPLAMAGEDTAVHALAVGGIGQTPEIFVVGDPRQRNEQYELIAWFGARIENYFADCRARGDFPQFWVSSGAAAGHLDILADRLRFTRDNPQIKRVGELLTYSTERMPYAGQQTLMTATSSLATLFATGQHSGDDEHLGVFLTWLSPPAGRSLQNAIAEAERQVMGVKTDPEFDRITLQPLVSAYDAARATHAQPDELWFRRQQVFSALSPIVTNIYNAVQQALRWLDQPIAEAPILTELRRQEENAFLSFMNGRDAQRPLPYRDKPRAAAYKMVEREHALQAVAADQIYGDRMAAARARWDGRLIAGQVIETGSVREGRKTVHRLVISTDQVNLHVRPRDLLVLTRDQRMQVVIEDVRIAPAGTHLHLRIKKGHQAVDIPTSGSAIELGSKGADWGYMIRKRGRMRDRLAVIPWTHHDDPAPPSSTRTVPTNLQAAIEALR
ncbi:hypothetical protein [Novosphingobium sp. BW1]|uniref:hypothetical protein n=1 Tax=Novosphingobium sp. BW1 TaxID=2592621 RepID=UPI0011DEA77D|nr:hypothetical protein [Novosphingobium sp. BW1]TYC78775.1 hypothetical protein FMM79_20735 [Novosphingobium sp. BW1]